MRAVLVTSYAVAPVVTEVPDPVAPAGGVVVRVGATGVCRSDWHAWQGHDDGVSLPLVPGHELAGSVAAVGDGVSRWKVGDRVTVPFVCACGVCEVCRAGDGQVCPQQTQPGFTGWGSWAELVALEAADHNLVALPDSLSYDAAAALGCRVATAWRALTARARVRPGEWVAVLGCGGVGLSAVMVATALGARVVAVDVAPAALAAARSFGADATVLATPGLDVPGAVADLTGGGAHVAVDALGSPQTCRDSVLALRRRGRQVQVGLLPPAAGRPEVPMDRVIAWELDVLGSHGMAAADYPALLAAVADGRLPVDRLVDRVVDLDEVPELLSRMGFGAAAGTGVVVARPRPGRSTG